MTNLENRCKEFSTLLKHKCRDFKIGDEVTFVREEMRMSVRYCQMMPHRTNDIFHGVIEKIFYKKDDNPFYPSNISMQIKCTMGKLIKKEWIITMTERDLNIRSM
jgi:hypothetical protein